jgi:hypothetical protein
MYTEACEAQSAAGRVRLQELWERHPTRWENKGMQPGAGAGAEEEKIDLSKLPEFFYVNTLTGSSQWAIPYYANSFPAVDVEASAFEKCVMDRDIVEKWYAGEYMIFVYVLCLLCLLVLLLCLLCM